MKLYGKELTKRELLQYVGDVSQIADAREGVMTAGKSDGVRSGLEFTVLPTRGMDISWASYQGKALSFVSKAGVGHPAYFEKDGFGFLRNFFCGLLTTCGLTYFGAPCVDNGEELGLHGRISNIPAKDVCVEKFWDGDDYIIRIRGQVRRVVRQSLQSGAEARHLRQVQPQPVLEVRPVEDDGRGRLCGRSGACQRHPRGPRRRQKARRTGNDPAGRGPDV